MLKPNKPKPHPKWLVFWHEQDYAGISKYKKVMRGISAEHAWANYLLVAKVVNRKTMKVFEFSIKL